MLNSVLTEQECNVLHNLVPLKSKINVGVVAKLYKAQNLAWISYGVGVCCGEKDHGRKSYFLRFYNLKSKSLAFEQEIFKEMEYTPSMSLFHIFQGSSCPYAISFVDQTSANNIENFINKTIEYSIVKSGKCLEKQTSVNKTNHSNVIATNGSTKSKKNSKTKLTAADIGIPMNFRHIEHVDLDPKKNMYNMSSPETQQLIGVLGQMGMGDVIHNDKEACLAMKFINKYGGLRALQSEGKNAISGPIQIQSKGPPPSRPPAFNPPNANINNNGNTLRSSRKLIPPPPVPSLRPPPPPPMVPPPSSGSTKNIPPPPPPPPPPVASGMAKSETPQPPKIPLPPIPTDGKPIKAVAPNPPSVEKKSSEFNLPVAPPSLQQQIINFSKERLKKTSSTTTDEKKETPKETQTGDSGLNTGLAMALVDALNRRRNMMDEEENSRSSSSENEWEEVH